MEREKRKEKRGVDKFDSNNSKGFLEISAGRRRKGPPLVTGYGDPWGFISEREEKEAREGE